MGIMITCHGHTNPVYNAYKTIGACYTQQNMMYLEHTHEPPESTNI